MSKAVNLDLPMQPGEAPPLRKLAHTLIKDSIIAQAAERLVVQIVQVCAEHEEVAVATANARVAELEAAEKTAREAQLMDYRECQALRARVAELEAALKGAWHALESYAHGNGSPELAISIAAHCKAVLGQESGK